METSSLLRHCLILASILSTSVVNAEKFSSRPNFVIILTDDQGYSDLGIYGSPDLHTPNIDRMAEEGIRFTDFYAQPSCGPSRAALLTGSYPIRVAEPSNKKNPNTTLHSKEVTIAEVLSAGGYQTGLIGKWHLAGDGEEPWDFVLPPLPPGKAGGRGPFDKSLMPNEQGFDYFFGTPMHNGFTKKVDHDRFIVELMRNEKVIESPAVVKFLSHAYTDEALKFIQRHKNKPFFLLLSHNMPHVPLGASENFRGKSSRGLYGDVIAELDWSVSRVLGELKKLNLEHKTLVVFASDNGPEVREELGKDVGDAYPLRGGKYSNWEGGVRVPAIMWWPGRITSGLVSNELVSIMDLFPTLINLSGGKIPDGLTIDGVNIAPLLLDESDSFQPRKSYFYYSLSSLQAVRSGDWKLVLPREKGSSRLLWLGKYMDSVDRPKLFNLRWDVSEKQDLSDDYPNIVASLMVEADKARKELGDYDSIGSGSRFFDSGPLRPKTYFP